MKLNRLKKNDTVHNSERRLYKCGKCDSIFSETSGTPMQDLKSPISKIASVLKIRSEGMEQRAAGLFE